MSRHLYRAKSVTTNNWIYGSYFKHLPYTPYVVSEKPIPEKDYKHLIIQDGFSDWGMPRDLKATDIILDTLCQSTNLKDKKGNLIYEKDIVIKGNDIFVVVYDEKELCFVLCYLRKYNLLHDTIHGTGSKFFRLTANKKLEVLGNIFDNMGMLNAK